MKLCFMIYENGFQLNIIPNVNKQRYECKQMAVLLTFRVNAVIFWPILTI